MQASFSPDSNTITLGSSALGPHEHFLKQGLEWLEGESSSAECKVMQPIYPEGGTGTCTLPVVFNAISSFESLSAGQVVPVLPVLPSTPVRGAALTSLS